MNTTASRCLAYSCMESHLIISLYNTLVIAYFHLKVASCIAVQCNETPLRHSFYYSSDLQESLYCLFQGNKAMTNVAIKVKD
jgi:hypothetical protein